MIRRCAGIALSVLFPLFAVSSVNAAGTGMTVGGNLWFHADWNIQTTFVDVMKTARGFGYVNMNDPGNAYDPYPWGTQAVAENIASGSVFQRDADGYPLEVPCVYNGAQYRPVTIVLCEQRVDVYPYGTFTFMCEGSGVIHLGWNRKDTIVATGGLTRKQFTIRQGDITFTRSRLGGVITAAGITMTIVRSTKGDHIRNIRLILPGYENTYESQVYDPRFLAALRPFRPIRFMDWCGANSGKQVTWAQRVTPTSFCQTGDEGVALEYMIDICNRINTDMWWCCPPRADDNYQTQAATMIKQRLKPGLKLYLEWANETWNGMFEGNRVSAERAGSLGISTWCYHGVAAANLFKNFQAVYGGEMSTRVVKVLSGQLGNDGVLGCVLSTFADSRFNPSGIKADVAAVTAYWGGPGPDYGALDRAKAQATGAGLKLVAYEGGRSSTNYGQGIYDNYASVLPQLNSRLTVFNQYCILAFGNGEPSWGAMDYLGQPVSAAYKWKALYDWQVAHGWFDPAASRVESPDPVAGQRIRPSARVSGTAGPRVMCDAAGRRMVERGGRIRSGVYLVSAGGRVTTKNVALP